MTDSDEEARAPMLLRVPEGLKTRAEAHAKRRGFSVNTVGILALEAWLAAEERQPDESGPKPKARNPRDDRSTR